MSWKFAELGWRQDIGLSDHLHGAYDGSIRPRRRRLIQVDQNVEEVDRSKRYASSRNRDQSAKPNHNKFDNNAVKAPTPTARSPCDSNPMVIKNQSPSFSSSAPLLRSNSSVSYSTRQDVYSSSSEFWISCVLAEIDANCQKPAPNLLPHQPRDFLAEKGKESRSVDCRLAVQNKEYVFSLSRHFTNEDIPSIGASLPDPDHKGVVASEADTSALIHHTAWPLWASFPNREQFQTNDRAYHLRSGSVTEVISVSSRNSEDPNSFLEYQGVLFEMLNPRKLLSGKPSQAPKGSSSDPEQDAPHSPSEKSGSRRFRLRKIMKAESDNTPYPGKAPILGRALESPRIPSHTPGMEYMSDPYSKLSPSIDIPKTPDRFKPGPASAGTRAKLEGSGQGSILPDPENERPLSILLPLTPSLASSGWTPSNSPKVRLHRQSLEEFPVDRKRGFDDQGDSDEHVLAQETGFGNDVPLRRLSHQRFSEDTLPKTTKASPHRRETGQQNEQKHSTGQLACYSPFNLSVRRDAHRSEIPESLVDQYGGSSGTQRRSRISREDGRRKGIVIDPEFEEETKWPQRQKGANPRLILKSSSQARHGTPESDPPAQPLPPVPSHRPYCGVAYDSPFDLTTPGQTGSYAEIASHPRHLYFSNDIPLPSVPNQPWAYEIRDVRVQDPYWRKDSSFGFCDVSERELKQFHRSRQFYESEEAPMDATDNDQETDQKAVHKLGSTVETSERRESPTSFGFQRAASPTRTPPVNLGFVLPNSLHKSCRSDSECTSGRIALPKNPFVREGRLPLNFTDPDDGKQGSRFIQDSYLLGEASKGVAVDEAVGGGSVDCETLLTSGSRFLNQSNLVPGPMCSSFNNLSTASTVNLDQATPATPWGPLSEAGQAVTRLPRAEALDESCVTPGPGRERPLFVSTVAGSSDAACAGLLRRIQPLPLPKIAKLSSSANQSRIAENQKPTVFGVPYPYPFNSSYLKSIPSPAIQSSSVMGESMDEAEYGRRGLGSDLTEDEKLNITKEDKVARPDLSARTQEEPSHLSVLEPDLTYEEELRIAKKGKKKVTSHVDEPDMTKESKPYLQHGLESVLAEKEHTKSGKEGEKTAKPSTNDTDESFVVSEASADGSYPGTAILSEAASTSSLIRELDPNTPFQRGTFAKSSVLGPKGNVTGSFRGTGMRMTGSSEADVSSDLSTPKDHRYEPLDGGNIDQEIPGTSQSTPGNARQVKFALQSSPRIQTVGGLSISAPTPMTIHWYLPPMNSLSLTRDKPLVHNICTETEILERISLARDDHRRMQSPCPLFPLRPDHPELTFLSSDRPRCTRGTRQGRLEPDGRPFESAYCQAHRRWEFSHAPTLTRRVHIENNPLQQRAGRELIWILVAIPLLGWVFLYEVWNDGQASAALIQAYTAGQVVEFHPREREMAGVFFKRAIGCLMAAYVALTAFCLWVVFH